MLGYDFGGIGSKKRKKVNIKKIMLDKKNAAQYLEIGGKCEIPTFFKPWRTTFKNLTFHGLIYSIFNE